MRHENKNTRTGENNDSTQLEEAKKHVKCAVGVQFSNLNRLNLKEKHDVQKKINTLSSYAAVSSDADLLEACYLLSEKIGPAVGEYAQYEWSYDLAHAQNTDDSVLRLISKFRDESEAAQ